MSPANMTSWLAANWPAPAWIKAGTTTRQSGFSLPPYASLNLAQHVGDKLETVEQNRTFLQHELQLPSAPLWLQQVHGKQVINSDEWSADVVADACYTKQDGIVCAVLTADCLPLLLCDKEGSQIAAIHVGWRGLCQGIIDVALSRFETEHSNILAWIGPHIHADNYEVGKDVHSACLQAISGTDHTFTFRGEGKWLASLEALVRHKLTSTGISMIYTCNRCTFDEQASFFSYRRQKLTGRMASLIWMETGNTSTKL
jgi:purine-nucleoside/S-methyl-5'-thioadenosine phosphorylase / adenosine deaminase